MYVQYGFLYFILTRSKLAVCGPLRQSMPLGLKIISNPFFSLLKGRGEMWGQKWSVFSVTLGLQNLCVRNS
jgi:hypothetical protein